MNAWKKTYGTDWDLILKVSLAMLTFVAGAAGVVLLIMGTYTRSHHP